MIEIFLKETFPFWDILSDSDKQLLKQNCEEVHFDKSQAVHNNTDCNGLYIVKSGKLRLYLLSEEGKEVTLYRLSPGDICMLSASRVLNSITFDVYVSAEMPSDCYRIDASAFAELGERVPEAKIFIMERAVSRFSDVMWVMQQIMFMSMDKRLAIFIVDESISSGSDIITMTHEQIVNHLGTAREVVSRLLKHFSADGIIEVSRKGIHILDKNKLRNLTL